MERPRAQDVEHPALAGVKPLQQVAPYYFDWLRHPPEDPGGTGANCETSTPIPRRGPQPFRVYDDNYGPEGATTNYAGCSSLAPPTVTSALTSPGTVGSWRDNTEKSRSGET